MKHVSASAVWTAVASMVLLLPAGIVCAGEHLELGQPRTIESNAKQWWAKALADINGDGMLDLAVIDNNSKGGWLGWYETSADGRSWNRHIVAHTAPNGMTFACGDLDLGDFDNDGDIDLLGIAHTGEWDSASSSATIYWYENNNLSWTPHLIGSTEAFIKDIDVADFNGDGKLDIAAVLFRSHSLVVFRQNTPTSWTKVLDLEITNLHEGMDVGDIDGDGDPDVATNGYWVESPGGNLTGTWTVRSIDTRWHSDPSGTNYRNNATKVFCQDITGDGRAEVFITDSENAEPIMWYEAANPKTGSWTGHQIANGYNFTHTLQVFDMDRDGDYDVVTGENGGQNNAHRFTVFLNNGDNLSWTEQVIDTNGTYNSLVGDVEGDGSPDIWRLTGHSATTFALIPNESGFPIDQWQRHGLGNLPNKAVFIQAGDLDGDGDLDLAAGGWWWRNPGDLGGSWTRSDIGAPLRNAFLIHDFDGDDDLDIVGTQAFGSTSNHAFAWARNRGDGTFDVLTNIATGGSGDFLQGRVLADFGSGPQIALSWHNGGGGVHALSIPANPSATTWGFSTLSTTTMKEDLSAGDIDRDGDLDLLLGTKWLRNNGGSWSAFTLGSVASGEPDRSDLVDVNGDGRLDAVVGLENGTDVYWYEAPANPTGAWTRHTIGSATGQGFSMDTADLDRDGQPDVVLGEHRGSGVNRVLIFKNQNGGATWTPYQVDSDPTSVIDHHDGTQAADLDRDGDLDLFSIGWYNEKIWVYENKAIDGGTTNFPPVASATATPTAVLVGQTVSFNGSGSSDLDGTIEAYYWQFGDGANAGGVTAQHAYATAGTYTVSLRVTDDDGAHGYATVSITVTVPDTSPPEITAVSGSGDQSQVVVVFNEPLDRASAETSSNYAIDNGVTIASATLAADSRAVTLATSAITDGQTYTLSVNNIQDLSGNTIAPNTQVSFVPNSGLEAHWRFDEGAGTTAFDSSGHGRDGTLAGAQWSTSGKLDGALDFNGSGARVNVGQPDVSGNELTLAAWLKADRFDHLSYHDVRVISKATGSAEQDHYWMLSGIRSSGTRLRFRLKAGSSTSTLIASSGNLTAGVWIHVAAVYDGSSMKLYKDGTQVGSMSKSGSIATNGGVSASIGANPDGYGPFDGLLDDVRVYSRALSQAEITALASGAPPPNQPPTAVIGANPQAGTAPLTVQFNGAGSSDPDGTITSYAWDFGDGTTAGGVTASHQYTVAGTYTATLTVTDDKGATGVATLPISVTGTGSWGDPSRPYRTIVTVHAAGYERTDHVAETAINFTSLLAQVGGAAFDVNSIRVMEAAASGTITNGNVVFQFDEDTGYNAATNASGTLVFLMSGPTAANATRYFHVYFGDTNGSYTAPSFTPLVTVTDGVVDEGQGSFRIATARATYYYHKQGAGFSSLVDANGNDWISYSTASGSAGEYRGIPNMGYPEGYMHPGKTVSSSNLRSSGPLKATITSASNDGKWSGHWEIYPSNARMTVTKVSHNYWFLYEGTPGGQLQTGSDFVVRSDGTQTLASQSWNGDIGGSEWCYFADGSLDRALFVVQENGDSQVDSYYPMNNEMTVFGFGRQGLNKYMSAVPNTFRIGLMDERDHAPATTIIEGSYRPLTITVGAAESNGGNVAPIARAGSDQTLQDSDGNGSEPVTLDGSGSTDSDGTIVSYSWTEGGAGIATGVNPTFNLSVGSHTITLTVTDNDGATATDTVDVTIVAATPNQTPVAEAGPNQTLQDSDGNGSEPVTLDGSGSTDSDGTIVSYSWTEGGAGIATGVNPTVNLSVGSHTVTLTVADNDGATATDTVVVTIVAATPNQAPVAEAGPNQALQDSDGNGSEPVTLDGSGSTDSDGTIVSHSWTRGGAGIATGVNPTVNLSVGSHTIMLTVTDNDGATASDTLVVTVVAPTPNLPPVIDSEAWADPATVIFPGTTTANVLCHDPDNGPVALVYTWEQVSGPGTASFSPNGTTNADVSTVSFDEAGDYLLRVTVSDGEGSVTSEVTVTVIVLDTQPPGITAVSGSTALSNAVVVFNEAIDRTSAERTQNYAIDGGVTISSASLAADARTVTLATSAFNGGQTYTLTVNNIQDLAGNAIAPNTQVSFVPESGSEAHWRFDEGAGTTALDSSGNGHDGTLVGPQWSTAGKLDGALAFDGSGDRVDVGKLDVSGNALTLAGWLKADRFDHLGSHDARIISKATGSAEQAHFWMLSGIRSNGTRLRFRLKTNGTTSTLIASSGNLTAGVWIHAAAVYDGSSMKLYKDGVLVGSRSKSGSLDTNNAVSAAIGSNPDGYGPFDGLLDDVRIYSRALSAAEITALVSGTPPPNQSPIARAGADQTIQDSDGSGSEPVTLNGSGSTDSDGTIVSYAWSRGGLGIATGVSPAVNMSVGSHTITLTVTDNDGATATDTLVVTIVAPTPNLPPVIDSGASANPATVNFPGTTTASVLCHDPDDGPAALVYTWEQVGGPGTASFSPNGTTAANLSTVSFDEAGNYLLRVTVSDGAASVSSEVTVTVVDLDTQPPAIVAVSGNAALSKVVVVFNEPIDRTSAERSSNYAIDGGVTISSATLAADARTITLATSALNGGQTYTLTVNGVQDLAGNAIAPNTQVSFVPEGGAEGHWRFDEGAGTTASDSSGNGNDGTLVGPQWSAAGKLDGALSFDGSGDRVDIGKLDVGGNALTLAGWLKADRFDHLRYRDARLISKATGSAERDHFWMLSGIKKNGTKLRFRLKTNGKTSTLIASSGNLTAGVWIHAAAVYDGSSMKLYKDGVLVGSRSKSGSLDTNSAVSAAIGSNPDGYGPFDGLLDDVRVYSRALSAAEITALASGAPSTNQSSAAAVGAAQTIDGNPVEELAVKRLMVKLNFARPDADMLILSGELDVPEGFEAETESVVVNVGGLVQEFRIDAKGRSMPRAPTESLKIRFRRKKGVIQASSAKFVLKLKKRSLSPFFADEGLVDADMPKPGTAVEVPVTIQFNGRVNHALLTLSYTAKEGRKGTGRSSR